MPIQLRSTVHIDTTDKSVHDLKHTLLSKLGQADNLILILQSFGYKHGIPLDADYVFDVRHLPNPHWELELRKFSGLDQPVQEFYKRAIRSKRCLMTFIIFWINGCRPLPRTPPLYDRVDWLYRWSASFCLYCG